jgi:meso-butanediol dehydrogenase/(S,S)-butanediol dehydrogenase/diacetyl reductase
MEDFAQSIVLGRVSTPADVAAVAAFLASGDAGYVTGQAILVDGGMVMH